MYHQLRSFISAADLKNLSMVGKKLFLTQPAITQHIRFLEDQLGAKLMYRSGSSMELTPEGRRLYNEAKGIVDRVDGLKGLFIGKDSEKRIINFSTIDSVTLSILPAAIKKVLSGGKDINFIPHVEASGPAIADLQKGKVDIALCTIDDLPSDIAGEPLFKEKMILICSKRNADPAREKLILFPKTSRTRMLIDRVLRDNKMPLRPDIETIKVSTIVAFVEAGMGISIVPYYSVYKDLKGGRIVEMPLKRWRTRTVGLAYKKDKTLSPLILDFINALRGESKKL